MVGASYRDAGKIGEKTRARWDSIGVGVPGGRGTEKGVALGVWRWRGMALEGLSTGRKVVPLERKVGLGRMGVAHKGGTPGADVSLRALAREVGHVGTGVAECGRGGPQPAVSRQRTVQTTGGRSEV